MSEVSPLPSLTLFYDFMEIGINLELEEDHSFSSMSFSESELLYAVGLRQLNQCLNMFCSSGFFVVVVGLVFWFFVFVFFENGFLPESEEFMMLMPFLCLPVLSPIQSFFMALCMSLLCCFTVPCKAFKNRKPRSLK